MVNFGSLGSSVRNSGPTEANGTYQRLQRGQDFICSAKVECLLEAYAPFQL